MVPLPQCRALGEDAGGLTLVAYDAVVSSPNVSLGEGDRGVAKRSRGGGGALDIELASHPWTPTLARTLAQRLSTKVGRTQVRPRSTLALEWSTVCRWLWSRSLSVALSCSRSWPSWVELTRRDRCAERAGVTCGRLGGASRASATAALSSRVRTRCAAGVGGQFERLSQRSYSSRPAFGSSYIPSSCARAVDSGASSCPHRSSDGCCARTYRMTISPLWKRD